MNDRQLDVWWMYKDPEAVLSPLKIILGHNFNICSLFSSLLYSLPQLSHIKLKLE